MFDKNQSYSEEVEQDFQDQNLNSGQIKFKLNSEFSSDDSNSDPQNEIKINPFQSSDDDDSLNSF